MKAFVLGMVALIVITAAAAVGLEAIDMTAENTYVEHSNVRL